MPQMRNPMRNRVVVVACGVGRDSTGMLVGLHERGIRPEAILFANVGGEKQGTYAFIPHLQAWLARVDFPPLTIVRYRPVRAPYATLEGNMLANATLPGATFNRGSCTLKFKAGPQNSYCRGMEAEIYAMTHYLFAKSVPPIVLMPAVAVPMPSVTNGSIHSWSGAGTLNAANRRSPTPVCPSHPSRPVSSVPTSGLKRSKTYPTKSGPGSSAWSYGRSPITAKYMGFGDGPAVLWACPAQLRSTSWQRI